MVIPSQHRCILRGLIFAGALIVGASALTPGSATAATPYSVLQINICNSGRNLDCYTGKATSRAGDLIDVRQPSVVTINEMCQSDFEPIRQRTGYHGVFTQSGSQTCTNGSAYGNALLFPPGTAVGTPHRLTYNTQSDHTELRTLTCVPAAGVTACVTHLSTSGVKSEQAAKMKDIVGDYARQGPTVLGGDWNIKYGGNPNAQDYVPAGMFRKGDGDVQHIMASSAHFGFTKTQIMDLDWTDHPALQVYLTR